MTGQLTLQTEVLLQEPAACRSPLELGRVAERNTLQ